MGPLKSWIVSMLGFCKTHSLLHTGIMYLALIHDCPESDRD